MNHEKVTMYGHLGIILAYLASNKTTSHLFAYRCNERWTKMIGGF